MKLGRKKYKRWFKIVTKLKFVVFHALLILASQVAKIGTRPWNKSEKSSFCNNTDFTEYRKEWRVKEIESLIPSIGKNDETKVYDDWWQFSKQIELFNKVKKEKLKKSCIHVLDKSMSPYIPRWVQRDGKSPNESNQITFFDLIKIYLTILFLLIII